LTCAISLLLLPHQQQTTGRNAMKVTAIKIKTNCHGDGFYEVSLSSFGGEFFGHCPSDLVAAFNTIEEHKEGAQHYINHNYIEILSITTREV
jgi:hypothetical protein